MFLPAFGAIMILRNSIQGMGHAGIPTLNGILESIVRILWTMWLIPHGTFHQLCFVNPTAWALAMLMLVLYYRMRVWKRL